MFLDLYCALHANWFRLEKNVHVSLEWKSFGEFAARMSSVIRTHSQNKLFTCLSTTVIYNY